MKRGGGINKIGRGEQEQRTTNKIEENPGGMKNGKLEVKRGGRRKHRGGIEE